MDLTEYLAIQTGILAGIVIGLHREGALDGIHLAKTIGTGYPLSDQGALFVEGARRAILDGIAKLDEPPSGPKLVG